MTDALQEHFGFSNLTGRPTGVVTRALGIVMPGVRDVQSQVLPYADAWRVANMTAVRGENRRWVAFGDSMTQGIGASDPMHGWVSQLARRVPAAVDVVNLSQSGARVEDLLELQIPAWRALPPTAAGEFVTVLIGSNDVMSPVHGRLLPEAFAELLEILPPGAIVASVPSPAGPAREANRHLADAARAGRVHAVPADKLRPSAWRGRLAGDRFHPNNAGYAMIADLFAPFVQRATLLPVPDKAPPP